MSSDLSKSLPRPPPDRTRIKGRYADLVPLATRHSAHLYEACAGEENRSRFDYLFESQPQDLQEVRAWIEQVTSRVDPMFFAVIDRDTGRCEGRQALMNIMPEHGTIELGSIFWGPAIARSRVATEAAFLHIRYAFDTLGYRRFEWKCNNQNGASKRAAERLGFSFEGVFRQHLVIKGANRDTAWYSIIDSEWPRIRDSFEAWLAPDNFDESGRQVARLTTKARSSVDH